MLINPGEGRHQPLPSISARSSLVLACTLRCFLVAVVSASSRQHPWRPPPPIDGSGPRCIRCLLQWVWPWGSAGFSLYGISALTLKSEYPKRVGLLVCWRILQRDRSMLNMV